MPPPTILVCDDDPGLRLLLRFAVEPRGYRIAEARDGSSCIELAVRLRPDLILLDGRLPDIGVETVIAAIRGESGLAETPLLLTTGSRHDLERYALEVESALLKPFSLEQLIVEIDRLLARPAERSLRIPLRRVQ